MKRQSLEARKILIKGVVSIGDKLEITNLNTRLNERSSSYVSQLLDFIDNNKACISMPIKKGQIIPLPIGEKYYLYCYTNKGLFQCKVEITDRYKIKNIYVLVIEFLSELEKVQRRQYYRIDCLMDILYHIVSEKENQLLYKIVLNNYKNGEEKQTDLDKLDEYRKVWYEGTVTDISGGGARFISTHLHQQGETINLLLDLGLEKKLNITCTIISSISMQNRTGSYENRVKYSDISKDDRETIIKFIFAEERRQRKREKGLD